MTATRTDAQETSMTTTYDIARQAVDTLRDALLASDAPPTFTPQRWQELTAETLAGLYANDAPHDQLNRLRAQMQPHTEAPAHEFILVSEIYDQLISGPDAPNEFRRYVRGDTLFLDGDDARRLLVAGSIRPATQPEGQDLGGRPALTQQLTGHGVHIRPTERREDGRPVYDGPQQVTVYATTQILALARICLAKTDNRARQTAAAECDRIEGERAQTRQEIQTAVDAGDFDTATALRRHLDIDLAVQHSTALATRAMLQMANAEAVERLAADTTDLQAAETALDAHHQRIEDVKAQLRSLELSTRTIQRRIESEKEINAHAVQLFEETIATATADLTAVRSTGDHRRAYAAAVGLT